MAIISILWLLGVTDRCATSDNRPICPPVVTSVLIHLLDAGEIDGALIATESDDDPWKAESLLATTTEELIENAGSFYNQTMALGNLDVEQWDEQLPDTDPEDLSLALVGTP